MNIKVPCGNVLDNVSSTWRISPLRHFVSAQQPWSSDSLKLVSPAKKCAYFAVWLVSTLTDIYIYI
jgi:hypothetical protein